MDKFIKCLHEQENDQIDDPDNENDTKISKINNVPFKYLFYNFYKCICIKDNEITASCQNCSKTVSGSTSSRGNFLSHIKVCIMYFNIL